MGNMWKQDGCMHSSYLSCVETVRGLCFVSTRHELSGFWMYAPEDRRLCWRSRRCRSGAKRPTLDLVKKNSNAYSCWLCFCRAFMSAAGIQEMRRIRL